MADKKKQDKEKAARVATKTLASLLRGESAWREEADRLRRLGLETGPDLEDQLTELKTKLEGLEADETALDASIRGLTPELFLAVLEVLTSRKNAAAVLRLRDRRPGRDDQKAIAAALHRLESQGVAIPKPASSGGGLVGRGVEPPEIYLTAPDRNGRSIMSIFWPGVIEEGCAIVRLEEQGLGGATTTKMTARGMKREMNLDERMPGRPVFPIDPGHALYRLQEAIQGARALHQFIPLPLSRLIHQLEDLLHIQPAQAKPQDAESIQPITGVTQFAAEQLRHVLSTPVVQVWTIEPEFLSGPLTRMMEALSSSLVVSEAMRQERAEALMRDAAAEYFTPERRQKAARRLEDIAIWGDRTGLPEVAREAWASALALKDASIPVGEVPFAVTLFSMNMIRLMREVFPPGAAEAEAMNDLREGMEGGEAAAPAEPDGPRIILP